MNWFKKSESDAKKSEADLKNTSPSNTNNTSTKPEETEMPQSSLFGGLDLSSETQSSSPPVSSGFSFVTNNASPTTDDTNVSSAFSFLASSTTTTTTTTDDSIEPPASGFGFLSPTTSQDIDESNQNSTSTPNPLSPTPSFSFLSQNSSPAPSQGLDLLGSEHKRADESIKLSKVASSLKVVKKKKRASKVGAAREDVDDVEEQEAPVIQQTIVKTTPITTDNIQEPVQVATTAPIKLPVINESDNQHEDQDKEQEKELIVVIPPSPKLPPPPLPGVIEVQIVEPELDTTTPITKATESDRDSPINIPISSPMSPKLLTPPIENEPANDKLQRMSNELFSSFTETSIKLCNIQQNAMREHKNIRADITSEKQKLRQISLKLSDAENEQQSFADNEEFDKADSLTSVIDTYKNEIIIKESNLDELTINTEKLEKILEDNRISQSITLDNILVNIRDLKNENELKITSIIKDASIQQSKEDLRLKVEEDRITNEKKHVQKDEEMLLEEINMTNEAIKSQSGDTTSIKTELEATLYSINIEIKELQLQLELKKAEGNRILNEIKTVDVRIGEVHKKYDRQLTRITERKKVLEENKSECLLEETTISKDRNNLNDNIKEMSELSDNLTIWFSMIQSEVNIVTKLINTRKNNSFQPSLSGTDINSSFDELNKEVTLSESKLLAAQIEERELINKIETINIEVKELDEKIVKMDNEKKNYASTRKFKEAAAVAKDMNICKTNQEELTNALTELSSQIEYKTNNVQELTISFNKATNLLREVQREGDLEKFKVLLSRISELRLSKKNLIGNSKKTGILHLQEPCIMYLDTELSGVIDEANIIKKEHSLEESLEEIDNDVEEENGDTVGVIPVDSEESVEIAKENNVAPAPQGEEKHFLILQVKSLLEEIDDINNQLDEATAEEDYELAAILDDNINQVRDDINNLLTELQCTEEYVNEYKIASEDDKKQIEEAAVSSFSIEEETDEINDSSTDVNEKEKEQEQDSTPSGFSFVTTNEHEVIEDNNVEIALEITESENLVEEVSVDVENVTGFSFISAEVSSSIIEEEETIVKEDETIITENNTEVVANDELNRLDDAAKLAELLVEVTEDVVVDEEEEENHVVEEVINEDLSN
jgi:hypothetical protein